MNREIKFRGNRRDNGEWCFGTYHYNQKLDHHYILAKECFLDRGEEVALFRKEVWEVFPESVGLYTGLKDKNGKEIYKGDIVSLKTAEQKKEQQFYTHRELVAFYRGVFSIGSGKLYEWSHEDGNVSSPLKYRNYIAYGAKDTYMVDFDLEVIGIHYETPELLNHV